jgi:hypothetical protein
MQIIFQIETTSIQLLIKIQSSLYNLTKNQIKIAQKIYKKTNKYQIQ